MIHSASEAHTSAQQVWSSETHTGIVRIPVESCPVACSASYWKLASKALLERPEVDLVRPRRPRLPMDLPIRLRDRVDAEQAVLAAFGQQLRPAAQQPLAKDAAVDDDVGDMQALRAELAGHALGDHPEAGLGRGEVREARLAAQAARGAGEDHRAAALRRQPPRRLAADQEAAIAADPPERLELGGRRLAEIDPLVVAGIEDHEIERPVSCAL